MLSKMNFEEQKANLHLDRTTMNAVQQAVNAGKIVTVHTDMITYGEWEGFGYIVTTPETGGAAYMISGGLNGGSSDGLVTLAYMVDIGFSIADIVEALQMIPTMLGLFAMGGPFGIIVGALVAAVIVALLVFAIMDYINSIQLMCRYMNGDEEAGKELEINAVINVGVAAGGAIVSKAAKVGLAKVAKKKIAAELGEELAEKLVKNSDSPGDIVKSLKKLNKNGVVESFYVLENQLVGMVIVRNPKPMQPLTLDKRMKGFDTSVVVRASFVTVAEVEFLGSFPICL